MSTNAKTVSRYATKQIILVGLFGALSTILMLLEFSLPFIPPFVKMDFSELPVILGGYLLGPLYGAYIAIVKVALNFVLNGTTTFGIGETVNLIGSLSFMLPAVFYYKYHRTFKGAITSLVIGTATATVVLLTANYFVIFPLYATAMHFPIDKIVALAATTNPFVTNLWTLMLFALLPFNVLKFSLSSVLSLMLYKKVEKVLKLDKERFDVIFSETVLTVLFKYGFNIKEDDVMYYLRKLTKLDKRSRDFKDDVIEVIRYSVCNAPPTSMDDILEYGNNFAQENFFLLFQILLIKQNVMLEQMKMLIRIYNHCFKMK